jgi:tetratricopeptide (TPR) repeat protein
MFINRNNFQKAAEYLKDALRADSIDKDTRAQWYYKLAVVSSFNEDYCEAIDFAGAAIDNKSDFGKAYIVLGDAIIASRAMLGEDIEQLSAYWAAADQYSKAASVDPSTQEVAQQKLADCIAQYPDREDLFFLDMKDGDPYLMEGCIKINTTVRSGN